MVNHLIWLTGLAVWIWIVLACVMILAVDLHDGYLMRRSRND
jgi:hypothetical protein